MNIDVKDMSRVMLEAELAEAQDFLRNAPQWLNCGDADQISDRIEDLRNELRIRELEAR